MHAGVLAHHMVDEVAADEAAAAGDDDVLGLCGLISHFQSPYFLLLADIQIYGLSIRFPQFVSMACSPTL